MLEAVVVTVPTLVLVSPLIVVVVGVYAWGAHKLIVRVDRWRDRVMADNREKVQRIKTDQAMSTGYFVSDMAPPVGNAPSEVTAEDEWDG